MDINEHIFLKLLVRSRDLLKQLEEGEGELLSGAYLEMLNESFVTFTKGGNYPKFGNVVIMTGGAGSGKSFILEKGLGIQGRIVGTDKLKEGLPKVVHSLAKYKKTKDPANTRALHQIVTAKYKKGFFKTVYDRTDHPETRLPNLILDTIVYNEAKLKRITDDLVRAGYKRENIHLVWVATKLSEALINNAERKRRMYDSDVKDTHEKALQAMLPILKKATKVQKYLDGYIYIVFNRWRTTDDIKYVAGNKKGSGYFEKMTYVRIKDKGKDVNKSKAMEHLDTLLTLPKS